MSVVAANEETETLGMLHGRKLKGLTGQAMIDYLMEAVGFLKHDDLDGWKEKFMPVPVVVQKPKNMRQSPSMAPVLPLPNCSGCGSSYGSNFDWSSNGSWDCFGCYVTSAFAFFEQYGYGCIDQHAFSAFSN